MLLVSVGTDKLFEFLLGADSVANVEFLVGIIFHLLLVFFFLVIASLIRLLAVALCQCDQTSLIFDLL